MVLWEVMYVENLKVKDVSLNYKCKYVRQKMSLLLFVLVCCLFERVTGWR